MFYAQLELKICSNILITNNFLPLTDFSVEKVRNFPISAFHELLEAIVSTLRAH